MAPGLTMRVSVSGAQQRTWQRKWRDVMFWHGTLTDIYNGDVLDQDGFTRCVETFFKNCHEVGDWVQETTGLPAKRYVRNGPTLALCDAISNGGKHHTRRPRPGRRGRHDDPITAIVDDLTGDETGIHADITWTSKRHGSGKADALKLADDCIREWEAFFKKHGLHPVS
ncbi:hypothetical protein [Mycobacterium simiae]|uniref:hypothetical protein n=1 Tax=Mycobacterium simiae TaxID=1784 RepID=UPI0026392805|nr:hypothetical protein [Mycobacterium simiae]